MGHTGRALGIEALQEQALVVAHGRPVIPLHARVVLDGDGVAGAVRVAVLDRDQHVVGHGRAVGHGERRALDRPVERAPHVDQPHAALQQRVGLVRQVHAHALQRRGRRLVDVRAHHRLAVAGLVGAADRVVEDEHALGRAGQGLQQQLLDLGVVCFLDALRAAEVGLGRACEVVGRHGQEGVVCEREAGFATAHVPDCDFVRAGLDIALWLAFRRLFYKVERYASIVGALVVVECGAHASIWPVCRFGAGCKWNCGWWCLSCCCCCCSA
jgi:hypothetical protein